MKTEAEIIEKLINEAREYARQWANADAGKTIFELASALEASEARAEAIATEAMDQTVYIIRQKEKIERLRAAMVAVRARHDGDGCLFCDAVLKHLKPGDLVEI
jgi:hypothetical protein